MLSHRCRDKFSKIAGMNAQIVLSWVDFWTVTLMWKNGQNETWMLLLIGRTVHRWWSELSVAPSGQKTKQSEVAGEYVYQDSGAEPWRHRYVSTASRNVIRSATRNQCSTGVKHKCNAVNIQPKTTKKCKPGLHCTCSKMTFYIMPLISTLGQKVHLWRSRLQLDLSNSRTTDHYHNSCFGYSVSIRATW